MSRSVQLVLLCEDSQHETFVRRFLDRAGWSTRLRWKAPKGQGSAGRSSFEAAFPLNHPLTDPP